MGEIDLEDLKQDLEFGTSDERLSAIMKMGDVRGETEKSAALQTLIPIVEGEEAREVLEGVWAVISILKLNRNGWLQQTAPVVYENLRDRMLAVLQDLAKKRDRGGPGDWLIQGAAVKALALSNGDKAVSTGLTEVIRHAHGERKLVDDCLCAIGAVGHPSSRDFLVYWREKKDNAAAQAALEAFAEPMEAVKSRMEEIKERRAPGEEKTRQETKRDKAPTSVRWRPIVLAVVLFFVSSCLVGSLLGAPLWLDGR